VGAVGAAAPEVLDTTRERAGWRAAGVAAAKPRQRARAPPAQRNIADKGGVPDVKGGGSRQPIRQHEWAW
jgi:hypothetical protein